MSRLNEIFSSAVARVADEAKRTREREPWKIKFMRQQALKRVRSWKKSYLILAQKLFPPQERVRVGGATVRETSVKCLNRGRGDNSFWAAAVAVPGSTKVRLVNFTLIDQNPLLNYPDSSALTPANQ